MMCTQLACLISARMMLLALMLLVSLSSAATAAMNAMNLGARFDEMQSQVTFRVYSSRATRIDLYLYAQPTGAPETASFPLTKDAKTDVWSTTLPISTLHTELGITGTIYYGYRAWGPNWPFNAAWMKGSEAGFLVDVDQEGNRFNPNKLLFDPYALEISHDPVTPAQPDGTLYASGPDHRIIDTGPHAPKGIVLPANSTSVGIKPTRPLKDDIIYEVHVRGLTKNDSSIPETFRGTYQGAALKAAYLKDLGVTAVEFLPVQETQNDTNDVNPCHTQGVNYWGYATLNYFAPDRHYAFDKSPGGPTKEFQNMVKAYHDAGLKVFIDVVYNHTGEGGAYHAGDPRTYNVMSWRGLDNLTYYSLTNDRQFSFDNTGVGGNYNTFNPIAQDLIVDSLAWWRDVLGVDGFRFDLASVLGNTCEHGCFHYEKLPAGTALNRIARELQPRAAAGGPGVELIAEPWAIGDGTFQLGNFPAGWSEWNGRYRDTLRKSQNKLGIDPITPGELARRFSGSSDLFEANGRRPWHSINLMVAHDGFTLADLYRFNTKNNQQPCPFGPSDGGTDDNSSWDQGGVAADQRKAARNGFAFLMLSAGTPMITGGDEFLRALQGNNNPYNLDTIANWLNFKWDVHQTVFQSFAKRLIAFRKQHPTLRPEAFYAPEHVRWFKPDGGIADPGYFDNSDNHALAWQTEGSAFHDPSHALYIAYNGWSGDVTFSLPTPGSGKSWFRVMDTSAWNEGPDTVALPGAEAFIGGESTKYILRARAVLLLIAQ